jgi:two-component system sensor histidine kinase BaeS
MARRPRCQPRGAIIAYFHPSLCANAHGDLLSNALRYTPEGGQIILSARQQADAVVLAVQDSGAGISPEALPHVFERFYRGDASRQQQDGESGLGLAIARSLVEIHGGRITAHSDGIGCGSTFSVYLPL